MKRKFRGLVAGSAVLVLLSSQAYAELVDIDKHWAKNDIKYLNERGIITGYNDDTFKPEKFIKRSEFFAVINRVFGFNDQTEKNIKDVKESDWFYSEVLKAINAGYIDGYSDGSIKPNDNITRQEAAKILKEVYKIKASSDYLNFKDQDQVGAWARESVAALVEHDYLSGYKDGTIRPRNFIKRGEISKLLRVLTGDIISTKRIVEGSNFNGNLVLSHRDIELKDVVIEGNLYITEATNKGSLLLDNVRVNGKIFIDGNADLDLSFENVQTDIVEISRDRNNHKIELDLKSGSKISQIYLSNNNHLIIRKGVSLPYLNIEENSRVTIEGELSNLVSKGRDNRVDVEEDGKLDKLQTEDEIDLNGKEVDKGNYDKNEIEDKLEESSKDKDRDRRPSSGGGSSGGGSSGGGSSGGGSSGGQIEDKDEKQQLYNDLVSLYTMRENTRNGINFDEETCVNIDNRKETLADLISCQGRYRSLAEDDRLSIDEEFSKKEVKVVEYFEDFIKRMNEIKEVTDEMNSLVGKYEKPDENTDKDDLEKRTKEVLEQYYKDLDLIQKSIVSDEKIEKLEGYLKDQEYLQTLLEEAAEKAVEEAEESRLQEDIDEARKIVDKLNEGELKDNLTNRLDNIDVLNPGEDIEDEESKFIEDKMNELLELEKEINNSDNMDELLELENELENIIKELEKNQAESNKKEDYKDVFDKSQELQDKIDAKKDILDQAKELEKEIEEHVINAELTNIFENRDLVESTIDKYINLKPEVQEKIKYSYEDIVNKYEEMRALKERIDELITKVAKELDREDSTEDTINGVLDEVKELEEDLHKYLREDEIDRLINKREKIKVNDLSSEVKYLKDLINSLKNKLGIN